MLLLLLFGVPAISGWLPRCALDGRRGKTPPPAIRAGWHEALLPDVGHRRPGHVARAIGPRREEEQVSYSHSVLLIAVLILVLTKCRETNICKLNTKKEEEEKEDE